MKLNNRVWLVIIPVIVFAYSCALYLVYQAEKQSYIKLEQSQLNSQLERMSTAFNHNQANLLQFTSSLIRSQVLQQALLNAASGLNAHADNRNLNKAVKELQGQPYQTLNIVIADQNGVSKYVYNNDADPFAQPNEKLMQSMEQARRDRLPLLDNIFVNGKQIAQLMVWNIDPLTMQAPVADRWIDNISFGVLVSFDDLNAIIQSLSQGIDYNLVIPDPLTIQPLSGLWNDIALTPNIVVQLQRNPSAIVDTLTTLAYRLSLIVIALVLCTAFLLVSLIQRFITSPIVALEESLKNLEEFTPKDSARPSDEIKSLEDTIRELNTQRAHAFQKIKTLAETDSLTELYNRRIFTECVDGIIQRANPEERIGLLYIDLDNFKFVNDNYGHDAGDKVLKEFAQQLKHTLRLTDVVMSMAQDISRLAGDEFSVIIQDSDSDSALTIVANRILALFENGFNSQFGNLAITASIGIAVFPHDGNSAEQLITRADAAMYQAKSQGKNQFTFYSQELADKALRQQRIEANLKLKRFDEFSMYYMPLYCAKTGCISGVEALMRWHSSELGFVSPAEFIPIAESRGLFMDLDMWVLNKVIDDLPELLHSLGSDCKIAINISSAQLSSNDFFYEVINTTSRRNVDRNNIVLEITETFGAEMTERVISNLCLFKQAGFRLALDDFGSGYTSILQLMRYPIDIIKIDKSITDHIHTDGAQLLEALVMFCKKQGFSVTAEGIELAEQKKLLIENGVDTLQGFYLAKPQPLSDLLKTINAEIVHPRSNSQ